ncbi:MAG TPA: hypothetical protein VL463_12335 [Kofleriaceae bacterium]|nr:hypothetical protein [Kofleriaceae bacterium]
MSPKISRADRRAEKQARVARLGEGAQAATPTAAPLRCPSCGAPVPLADGDVATCVFCKAEVPLPQELRALRDADQQGRADRAEAEALYRSLGKPPSTILRAWVGAAELFAGALAGLLMLLFWLSSATIVLSGLLLELVLHWIAPLVRIDLIDRFGGGTTYAGFVVAVVMLGLFPKWLVGYLDQSAKIRVSLQANLAARPPERVGFPSTCRECGAALAVPPGALGVRCAFCGSDNLVALPREWLAVAGARQAHFHASIVDAVAQARALRADARRGLWPAAKWLAGAAVAFGLVGKCAVYVDEEQVATSYAHSMGSPRVMVSYWDPTVEMPIDQLVEFKQLSNFTVALRHGEIFEISSPDGGACTTITIHNTTTFPLFTRDDDVAWGPLDDGTYGAQYRVPYTGLFKIEINGIFQTKGPTHARWRATRSAAAGLRVVRSVRAADAAAPPAPTLAPAARAAVDALGNKEPATAVALSSDGRRLAVASPGMLDFASIPDDPTKTQLTNNACLADDLTALAFIDAHTLASGDRHGAIWIWDVDLAMARARLPDALPGPITSLAVSPDGKTITAGYAGGARTFTADSWR